MRQKFFTVPFASSGDATAIPDAADATNNVSYAQGWTSYYSLQYPANPAAKPITRVSMNYLFNAITTSLQALQSHGVPEWITAANNDSVAYPYDIGAHVLYSASGLPPFVEYINTVAANTATPGVDATWKVAVNYASTQAQVNAGIDTTTAVTPATLAAAYATLAELGSYAGYTTQAAGVTLTNAFANFVIANSAAAADTITLPLGTTMRAASRMYFVNNTAFVRTVVPQGSDTITGQSAVASVAIAPGQTLELTNPTGSANWRMTGGSAMLQYVPVPVGAATAAGQATNLGQVSAMYSSDLGGTKKMRANAVAAATNVVFTDDQIAVATAFGGTQYVIPNASLTLNLASVGIGGMDTGTATANSWLAVYAAVNPALLNASLAAGNTYATAYAAASGVFATQDISTTGTLYSGANRPAGYTATSLIGYLRVSATAGQLARTVQVGRALRWAGAVLVSGTISSTTPIYSNSVADVPYGTGRMLFVMAGNIGGAAQGTVNLASDLFGTGVAQLNVNAQTSSGVGVTTSTGIVDLGTARTVGVSASTTNSSFPLSLTMQSTGFEF